MIGQSGESTKEKDGKTHLVMILLVFREGFVVQTMIQGYRVDKLVAGRQEEESLGQPAVTPGIGPSLDRFREGRLHIIIHLQQGR